ncbi:MAG: class I SAM-dependent methyltransferase [Chloroflexota bacterium]|nr:class I SAM-dependent methyltransferase [Chloroflexota bacterium]
MGPFYRYPGAAYPETYEWENRIADPEQRSEAFIQSVAPIDGKVLLDIGAGSAFHAVRFAVQAARVYAVEPDPDMLRQAFRRLAGSERANVSMIAADAEAIPLRDELADVIHSRFAYFFGPLDDRPARCVPGIDEALRMLKPDGTIFIIDNCLTDGEFAGFLRRFAYVPSDTGEKEEAVRDSFWRSLDFEKQTIASNWIAPDRDILRQVISMEFPAQHVERIMEDIDGTQLSYHYDVYWRRR